MRRASIAFVVLAFVANVSHAAIVEVEIRGTVVFNGIGEPPLSGVMSGETALVSLMVDSDLFEDGVPGDTRGYEIDQPTFSLGFSGGVSVGLQDPFPDGRTPFFTLVEGFPVSDGFFVSASSVSPGGVPLEQEGLFLNVDLGYDGSTLDTLDILDALGMYGFEGLTRFGFGIWEAFPDNVVLAIDFESMTISDVAGTPVDEASWGAIKADYR